MYEEESPKQGITNNLVNEIPATTAHIKIWHLTYRLINVPWIQDAITWEICQNMAEYEKFQSSKINFHESPVETCLILRKFLLYELRTRQKLEMSS